MPQTPRYAVGQLVEILEYDFTIPGFPRTWQRGVVLEIEPVENTKLINVMVRVSDGSYSPQIVGPRGGNRNIR